MTGKLTVKPSEGGNNKSRLLLLVLEIVVPVAFVDLADGLVLARSFSVRSMLGIPFRDLCTVTTAIWGLVVLNCGPFPAPRARKTSTKDQKQCR